MTHTVFPKEITCFLCNNAFIGSVFNKKYGSRWQRILYGEDFFLGWNYNGGEHITKNGISYWYPNRFWHQNCADRVKPKNV